MVVVSMRSNSGPKPLQPQSVELVGEVKAAVAFLGGVAPADRSLLFYHADSDGCTAAAQLDIAVSERWGWRFSETHPVTTDELNFEQVRETALTSDPAAIVFVDLSIQDKPQILLDILSGTKAKVLIYDDHAPDAPLVHPRLFYLNPTTDRQDDPALIPALFAYYVQKELGKTDTAWLAGIGMIGDRAVERHLSFFEAIHARFPGLLPTATDADGIYRSPLGKISGLINANFLSRERRVDVRKLLVETAIERTPESLLDADNARVRQLHLTAADVWAQIDKGFAVFSRVEPREVRGIKLFVGRLDSEARVCGTVASRFSSKVQRSIIVAYQRFNNRLVIELRRSRDCDADLVSLVRSACRDVPCLNVGGHRAAAGAAIREEHEEAFLRSLERAAANGSA
jgi:single-stranded DNA-specific DHH superfamily exonuclease